MARGVVWALSVVLLAGPSAASAAAQVEANLKVVGRWELDQAASYGDVAVVGTTALVTTESPAPCPVAAVTLVDVKNPAGPRAVGSIAVPPGMAVAEVEAATVTTQAFTGDLAALALVPLPGAEGSCGDGAGATVAYHDVTDPSHPRFLGQSAACGGCGPGHMSVSLAQRADGRVVVARTNVSPPGVAIDDVSDPARPVTVGQWSDPEPRAARACVAVDAALEDDAMRAVAAFTDGRLYGLDLADPSQPSAAGDPARRDGGRASPHAAVMPLGSRTVAIVAEDGLDDAACGDGPAPDPTLRALLVSRGGAPVEEQPVRYPGAGAPGRLVASGTLAYVAWHGAGVRVIDFAEVRPRTVAQFIPTPADVVGVGLLPQHIVVTDSASGLYVLERPDEAGGRAGFWSQFLSLLPYFGGAVVMAAVFAVPRLAMGAPGTVRSRVPSGARRRA